MYYPDDDGRLELAQLKQQRAVSIDTRSGFLLFDGNRAHSVEPILPRLSSVLRRLARLLDWMELVVCAEAAQLRRAHIMFPV